MASRSLLLSLLLSPLPSVICVPQGALTVTAPPTFLQSAAAPDLAGPQSSAGSCGGCYLVADVAGLVWYSEIFINTAATAMVSVGLQNGTQATRTSIIQNEGDFTFSPAAQGTGAPPAALAQINYDSTVNVGGALLTSPTAYNVFTAYSVTSEYMSNGVCMTSSGSRIPLSSAYSETLSSASGHVYLDANGEQQFINHLGFSTCSGGGENVVPTALVQVVNTTATSTMTFSNVPLAAMSASLTIAPQSTSASASASPAASSSIVIASAAAPAFVLGSSTVTPTIHPLNLPTYNGTMGTPASTGAAAPTGNTTTAAPVVPFISEASTWRKDGSFLALWIAGMVGLGAVVRYM